MLFELQSGTPPQHSCNEGDVSSVADCKKNDGLGRIQTGDLRRVKTEDLELSEAFSVGEMTTSKGVKT